MQINISTHEEWVEWVKRLLAEREGIPILIAIRSPHGLELLANFEDDALLFGILHAAKLQAQIHFTNELVKMSQSGQSEAYANDIARVMGGKKSEVN